MNELPRWRVLPMLLLLASGCGGEKAPQSRDVPVPVIAEVAVTRPIRQYVETVGAVEAEVTSRVGSVLPGRLEVMTRDVGDLVPGRRGDPAKDGAALLARLDIRLLEAGRKRADAEVRQAEAGRTEAKRKWDQAEDLLKQKLRTPDQRDAAKAAYDVAAAAVERAQAARREIEVQIEQSSIYAPSNAVVIEKLANVGDVVQPGQPLYRLECIRDLKVRAILPERDVPAVRARKQAVVRFDALPGRTFQGAIHALVPSGDPLAHSFIADIRLRNHRLKDDRPEPLPDTLPAGLTPDDLLLKPGMFARVRIVKYEKPGATVIPKRCVAEEGPDAFVYIIADGAARKTPVKTGVVEGLLVEVTEGLEPGTQVVGRGIENVTEGQPVRVIRQGAPPDAERAPAVRTAPTEPQAPGR